MDFCFIGIHDWTKWSDIEVSRDNRAFQLRKCLNCGKVEMRLL